MAWQPERSGAAVCEVSGVLRARLVLVDSANVANTPALDASLTYTLKLNGSTVLSGTAARIETNILETAITITTALDVSKLYEEEWTGTIVSLDGDTETVIHYRRAVRPQTFPIRFAPVTEKSVSLMSPIGTAPAAFGSWRIPIDMAWETVMSRALAKNAGDLLTPGVLTDACAYLALARIHGYLAGFGSQSHRERSDYYMTLYSVEMERLDATWDRNGDGVADVTKGSDGLGVGAL